MSKYIEIDVAAAREIILSQEPIVLDTRDAHSYKEAHIEGALLAHDGLLERLIKQRQFSQPIIIYCYHGNSSKELAEFFGGIGFKQVYSLMGGFVAWKKGEARV